MGIRDRILKSHDLEKEELDIPEWGGKFTIRELTGTERDELTDLYLEAQVPDPANKGELKQMLPKHYKARICIMGIVDDDGSRVFDEEHLAELSDKSARILDRVTAAICDLSGMAGISIEMAKQDFADSPNGSGGSELQEL